MKLQHEILATAVILAASATTAYAAPFKMNIGANIDGVTALGRFGKFSDTNTYAADGGGAGINGPAASLMNFNPNVTSVYTQTGPTVQAGWLHNGDGLTFTDMGSVPISSFNNNYTNLLASSSSMEGFGTTWTMHVDYSVSGTAVVDNIAAPINMNTVTNGQLFAPLDITQPAGLVPTFTGGIFKFYVDILPAATVYAGFGVPLPAVTGGFQVLELDVDGGQLEAANLTLNGTVDYNFADAAIIANRDFFAFADGTTFFSLWAAGNAPTWGVNTNFPQNLIPRSGNLGANFPKNGAPGFCPLGSYCRSIKLNESVQFLLPTISFAPEPDITLPEPDMALMMGVGIMGLGFATAKRRRKQLAA